MIYVIDPASCIITLRRAKELLDEGLERYICLALAEVIEESGMTGAPGALSDYIGERCSLTSSSSPNLEHWLYVEMRLTDSLPENTYTLCRMAWIDKMIETLRIDGCLP